MACYRKGGCGPYENRSCNECPASKPEYATRTTAQISTKKDPDKILVKVFINESGVISALTNTDTPMAIEVIDEGAIAKVEDEKTACAWTKAYMCQLCGEGYVYVDETTMTDRP